MKTYKERTDIILEKANTIKKNQKRRIRTALGAGISACAVALGLFLFVPYNTNPPSVNQYQENEYYDIIAKLNQATFKTPHYDNNFEAITDSLLSAAGGNSGKDYAGTAGAEGNFADIDLNIKHENAVPEMDSEASSESYEEITDNQVAGVIEGDRIKRSSKHIYYMNFSTLSIYTIEGENSKLINSYSIEDKDGYKLSAYQDEWEMFLSEDCSTITILSSCYNSDLNTKYVCLINLDVTDPENITESKRTYLSGSYLTSRLVDDEILLISHFRVEGTPDFSDVKTFIPQYGTPENMVSVSAADIISPDELSSTLYTVACKIDEKTLEAKSTAAFLSYAEEVYVSTDNIYASRSYSLEDEKDGHIYTRDTSQISAMSYSGETLEYVGSVEIAGSILNQYNMDEYEGILRVVTTTNTNIYKEYTEGGNGSRQHIWNEESGSNASLYCIDLSTWQVVASVESFAPQNESVQSVRFDKDKAYVCTAIALSDPVFVFDLSDLNNITYKDTGTITGYSISLINFGNGYLLGVGYGDSFNTLKLEIYEETETGVISVCSYEVDNCDFATEYKSYYINRDKHLIGIGYNAYGASDFENHYTLLQFDGYDFIKVIDECITGINDYKRAVLIDGYFYMFGENFVVKKL